MSETHAMDPPSPERPVYRKVEHGEISATRMFMITCDEGWRSHIVCVDMYEWAADWLLGILGRQPFAKTPAEAAQ